MITEKYKVLVVEDNPINVIVLKKFMEPYTTPDVVVNGKSALEILSRDTYDLIFMDINLGDDDLSGLDVIKKIRENEATRHNRIVVVTAYAFNEELALLKHDHNIMIITKPVSKEMIRNIFENNETL
jgi:CheY-like chemotaxis protein